MPSPSRESNKQILQDRTLNLPFFSRDKRITSLKNHSSLAQGESLPYWLQGSVSFRVCFDLLIGRISCL